MTQMLDLTTKSLDAAIAAHTTLVTNMVELAADWADCAVALCPSLPDCDHSERRETHVLAVAQYELAQQLLAKIERGKLCVECAFPIPDPQLGDQPEKCLLHKDPG